MNNSTLLNSTASINNEQQLSGAQILANAQVLADNLKAHGRAAEIDSARRLPDDIVDQLRDAGIFRMNMPAIWGGPEMTSMEQVEVVETLARSDASVGWCAGINCDSGLYSGYLEDAVARELFPKLDMAQAGWIYPAVNAERVQGGYRVSGRWIFGSGCNHCDRLAGGVWVVKNGKPVISDSGMPEARIIIAPRDSFTIEDTWHTTGLRGTGSNDYVADDLFVAEEHTFSFYEPKREGVLWQRPDTLLRKMVGIPLGVARDCIDAAVAILEGKSDRISKVPYKAKPDIQRAIGEAEALLGAARAYVFSSLETQWIKLERNEEMSVKERVDPFLSRQFAFQAARKVTQIMYDTVGGAAVYAKSPFDRHLRDMITGCQHIMGQAKSLEPCGALMLGADFGPNIMTP